MFLPNLSFLFFHLSVFLFSSSILPHPSFLAIFHLSLQFLLLPSTFPSLSFNFPLIFLYHPPNPLFLPPNPLFHPATRLPLAESSVLAYTGGLPSALTPPPPPPDSSSGSATHCMSDLRISYMRRQCTGKLCVENLNIIHLAHIVESPERHNERVRLQCEVNHSTRYGRFALGKSPCGWDICAVVG